jgi:hypothetical protein
LEEVVDLLDLGEEVLFGVSCPEQNNFVCFLFHITNILPQFINNFLISTQKDVVGSVGLVGCDKVAVEGSWERHDRLELGLELSDQVRLKHFGALAGVVEVGLGDIPAIHNELSGLHHWKNVFNSLVHVLKLTSCLIKLEANVGCRALSEGAIEIGVLDAILGLPRKFVLVSEKSRHDCRTIVATNTDEHDTEIGYLLFCCDCVLLADVLEALATFIENGESL